MNSNTDMLSELIRSIGLMTEMQIITYNSFKNQKLSDEEAMTQTKTLMSIMLHEMIVSGKEENNDQT